MKNYLKNYVVPFSGLKLGKHDFNFELGPKFFACFEASSIQDAAIYVEVVLEKQASLIVLHFDLKGTIQTECDRCNGSLEVEEKGSFRLIVKFSDQEESSSEEIVFLPDGEVEIDLSQYLYEFAHLLLPQKRVHKEGECDAEMLKILEKMSGGSSEENKDTDPRWDALKKLNN